jgi:hypothetical protein
MGVQPQPFAESAKFAALQACLAPGGLARELVHPGSGVKAALPRGHSFNPI